jgi:hypothetical protein
MSEKSDDKQKKKKSSNKVLTAIKIPFVAIWVQVLKIWADIKR